MNSKDLFDLVIITDSWEECGFELKFCCSIA